LPNEGEQQTDHGLVGPTHVNVGEPYYGFERRGAAHADRSGKGVVKLSFEIWDSRGEARKSGWIGPP
jgi:hypothetical protein